MMGGFSVGFGFIFLYNSANNYLVDTYQHQAASALAAKTFLRSIWGAGVVLFTTQMYDTLGLQGASSLLAGLGVLCCAIPFVFYFKGAAIRFAIPLKYHALDVLWPEVADANGNVRKQKVQQICVRRRGREDVRRRSASYEHLLRHTYRRRRVH
jgi:hypothetical protein